MDAALMDESSHSARRDRSIRLAVVTAFLSKAGNALLQLVSIPVAARVLGKEELGLYSAVGVTLGTISLLQVGIGPALAHGISKANANGDDAEVRRLSSSAFYLSTGLGLLAGLIFAAVLLTVPLPAIFGESFAGKESVLRPALWTGLGLFVAMFVFNLTDRTREGLLEASSNNVWGAAGNVLAAIAVGVGVLFVPQVWFLVLAVHGSLVVAKLCNTIALWRKHPEVRPAWTRFRLPVAKHLFTDGLAFSAATLITGVVEYNLCGWLVGRHGGPAATALYGVFISMTVMQLGFVMMLSTPTWPAVASALARGDVTWARKAAKKLYLYGSGFALCAFAGLVLLGPWVFSVWLGKEFSGLPRVMFAAYGLYFAAHVWRHLNHAMMIGTGQVGKLARIQFVESTLAAGAAYVALEWGGIAPMLAAVALSILAITGWILPREVAGRLRTVG
ncbi:lipopolysaccharide biosynthesis protein [Luteolibacter flavescens]|uniref:Lipopolysaccharide biosynthesis protein n=1 Tax=Luteolibacter flavescens TaxID=1859460 RepID=A0ABT3FTM1_9BACT|nr:lipopolysaccharide biosynthesis protein [Luteolibacter flavescens]MCW1886936.1 lipopolysaccharide biosynthesis protein [Luteolibacter flavescens]